MSYQHIVKESEAAALKLVTNERQRQRTKFDYDHDDAHEQGELVTAATCLLIDVDRKDNPYTDDYYQEDDWIQELANNVLNRHGTDYKSRLVIVAAMVLAEIERLERIERCPAGVM